MPNAEKRIGKQMHNNTDETSTRQVDLDKAATWLADAKTWIKLADQLTSESASASQDNKLNIAYACIGLAFQMAYNSLLVVEAKWPRDKDGIEETHNRLQRDTQITVEEWIAQAGCDASVILKSLDTYMNEYTAPSHEPFGIGAPGADGTPIADVSILIEILRQLFRLAEEVLTEAKNARLVEQPNPDNDLDAVLAKINEIVKKSEGADYIYRGEPERYNKVASTLYRHYEDAIKGIDIRIDTIHREMLRDAKRYAKQGTNFEILTQLQHFGGKTNLIDFTTDYLVALFFACDGSHGDDGRIVLLKETETSTKKYRVKVPRNPQNRIIAQKSVFVRPPKGFIEFDPDDVIHIPGHLKKPMIDYLQKHHDISSSTIYNDIHGFIRRQDIHARSDTAFFQALTCSNNEDYPKAIWHFTEALRYSPQWSYAYINRGLAYSKMGRYDYAMKDFDKAIELDPNGFVTYNNRGAVFYDMGKFDRAIEDFDKVIELKPRYVKAHYNRGVANCDKGDYDFAIRDFSRVIELKPDDADAHYNRGLAHYDKGEYALAVRDLDAAISIMPNFPEAYCYRGLVRLHVEDWESAKSDLTTAKNTGENIAEAFSECYANTAEFEQKIGTKLPEDIVALIHPS